MKNIITSAETILILILFLIISILSDNQSQKDLLTERFLNENHREQTPHTSLVYKQLFIADYEFDKYLGNFWSFWSKKNKNNEQLTSLVTSLSGLGDNSPIILTSANKTIERFISMNNRPVNQISSNDCFAYYGSTPKPQTIFVFGSSLTSLAIFKRFRKKSSSG